MITSSRGISDNHFPQRSSWSTPAEVFTTDSLPIVASSVGSDAAVAAVADGNIVVDDPASCSTSDMIPSSYSITPEHSELS